MGLIVTKLSSGPMKASLNDESLVRYAKRCWLHEAAWTRMQCKWFAEQSIAAHTFSCQYVDKSSWQNERKVFREDEGTTSVVLDEQKRLGFAELAGTRLCSPFFFLPELRFETKGKCKSSTARDRSGCVRGNTVRITRPKYSRYIRIRCHPYISPDLANIWLIWTVSLTISIIVRVLA